MKMAFSKKFLFLALLPLVVAVVEKVENKNERLDQSVPELRPENTSPLITHPSVARLLAELARLRVSFSKLKSRMRSFEAYRLRQIRGRDGRDGPPGKPGKDGRDGRDGAKGPRGPRGFKGNPGRNGARGRRGPPGGGVQYVRWGKTSCPSGSSLVYKGRIGGEHYAHRGGGSNYVCLTMKPKYVRYRNGYQNGGRMYGTEYEVSDNRNLFPGKNLHDHEAPCAVCYARSRSAKLVIPATYVCPSGWRREYWGYLMTAHYSHAHSTEFICVDKGADAVAGSYANRNGALLYPVQGTCGSLPCGPYVGGRELTCAVCTK